MYNLCCYTVIGPYFASHKGVLISDIHCIRHAGYKNMPDIRTLHAIPNDFLITDIHCRYFCARKLVSNKDLFFALIPTNREG